MATTVKKKKKIQNKKFKNMPYWLRIVINFVLSIFKTTLSRLIEAQGGISVEYDIKGPYKLVILITEDTAEIEFENVKLGDKFVAPKKQK